MARIRLGDFGATLAPPVGGSEQRQTMRQAFVAPEGGLADSAMAASGHLLAGERQAAREAEHEAKRLALEAERERKHDEERTRRNRVAAAQSTYKVELATHAADIGNRLVEGQLKREDAEKEFNAGFAKVKKAHIEGLDPKSQEDLADNIIAFDGQARLDFQKALRDLARKDRAGAFTNSEEAFEREARLDPQGAIAKAEMLYRGEGAALFGAEKAAKGLQQFKERVTYNQVYSGITAASQDPRALAAWSKRLQAGEFDALDPGKRESLVRSVQASQLHLEQKAVARAQREELRAQREARKQEQTFSGFQQFIATGKTPSSEYLAATMAKLSGSPFQAAAVAMMGEGKQTAAFATQPLAQQRAEITALRGQSNVEGSNPKREQQIEKLERITRAADEEVRTQGIVAAVERGVIRQLAPVDFADLANLGPAMAARNEQAAIASRWAGRPVSPFTNDEAAAFTKLVTALKPEAKAQALKFLGQAIPDPQAMRATATQIDPHDKTLATAMFLASRDLQTMKGRPIAELYLNGMDAIKTKSAKIDETKEIGVRAEIAKQLAGVYLTPQGRDLALDATLGVYAAGKAEGRDRVEEAVNLVTGGLMKHNGAKIAKPYGWTDSQFRDAIRGVTAAKIQAQGGDTFRSGKSTFTAEEVARMLSSARLQTVDDGRYAIIAGPEYLRRADGQPFILNVSGY